MDWLHTKWCKSPHSKLSSKAVSSLNRSCLGGVVSGDGSFGWMNRGQPEWCQVFLLLKTGIDAVVYELISFRFIYMIYMQFIHRWWVWTQTFQLTIRSMLLWMISGWHRQLLFPVKIVYWIQKLLSNQQWRNLGTFPLIITPRVGCLVCLLCLVCLIRFAAPWTCRYATAILLIGSGSCSTDA